MNRLCSSHTVGADFRIRPKAALAYCDLSAPQQSLPMGIDRQLCGYLIVKASTRHGLKPGL